MKEFPLVKEFLSELEVNFLEKPLHINEHPTENFIYLIWFYDNFSLQIEFHSDGEIILMKSINNANESKTLKEYSFKEIINFLEIKTVK